MFNRKKFNQNYHKKHKKEINKRKKIYYQNNTEKLRIIGRKQRLQNLKSWENYIPSVTYCQICGKKIYFNKKEVNQAINFDHKHRKVPIKNCPTAWLSNHRRILKKGALKNQKIWESCNFGMLCQKCNRFLPTTNRKKFLKNAVKYVFGKELLLGKKRIQQ